MVVISLMISRSCIRGGRKGLKKLLAARGYILATNPVRIVPLYIPTYLVSLFRAFTSSQHKIPTWRECGEGNATCTTDRGRPDLHAYFFVHLTILHIRIYTRDCIEVYVRIYVYHVTTVIRSGMSGPFPAIRPLHCAGVSALLTA